MAHPFAGFARLLRDRRSPGTIDTYLRTIEALASFLPTDDLAARKWSRPETEAFLGRPRRDGARRAASVRNRELAALRSYAQYAIDALGWEADPTKGVPFLREPRRDPVVLSAAELGQLFHAARALDNRGRATMAPAALALLSQAGLRVHEHGPASAIGHWWASAEAPRLDDAGARWAESPSDRRGCGSRVNTVQLRGDNVTTFTWLHLTDLHIGMASAEVVLPGVKRHLFDDIKRLDREVAPIDVVFFTGDLTQQGEGPEFRELSSGFLKELMADLGREVPLLAVPGNHDLARPTADDPLLDQISSWGDPAQIPRALWTANHPMRVRLNQCFAEYLAWSRTLVPRREGWLAGDFATTLEKEGVRIGVVGLNSTFLQLAPGDYDGRLSIHAAQLHGVCGGDGPRWLGAHDASILLTHQPPSWLHPKAREHFFSEIHTNDHFAVHLCGHMHETRSSRTQDNDAATRQLWLGRSACGLETYDVAGEGGPDRRVSRSHGYALGQLRFEPTEVDLRFWARSLVYGGSGSGWWTDRDTGVRPAPGKEHTPPHRWPRRERLALSPTLHSVLARVVQRTNRIELRAQRWKTGTVLMLDGEDLFTLVPAVLETAQYQVRSTSVLDSSIDFWASERGSMVLRASRPPDGKAAPSRLFIGTPSGDKAHEVIRHQLDAGLDVQLIDRVTYEGAVRPLLPGLIAQLRELELPGVDLDLALRDPTTFAVAVYGVRHPVFLGFDLPRQDGAGSKFAFVFEPADAMVTAAGQMLDACFKRAHSAKEPPTPKRKTLVLLGAHRWKRSRVVREALAADLDVVLAHCADDTENMIGPDLKSIVHGTIELTEPRSESYLRRRAEELTRTYPDGWYGLGLDDYVCETAGLLGPIPFVPMLVPSGAESTMRRKHQLRRWWNDYCRQHPEAPLYAVEYEYREFASFDRGAPPTRTEGGFSPATTSFIVKPDELSASIEIHRATSPAGRDQRVDDVLFRLGEVWSQTGANHGITVRPRVLIEAEIPRRRLADHPSGEFSVEVLSEGGRHSIFAVTQKWISERHVELGHVVPAPAFPIQLRDDLERVVSAMLDELEVYATISHFEFIVTPDLKLALVEAQPRPAGDQILDLVARAYLMSPERRLFHWMAGRTVTFPAKPRRAAAIAFLRPLAEVRDYDQCELDPGPDLGRDLFIHEHLTAGSTWTGPSDWTNRYLSVIGEGSTVQAAREACRAAAARIHLLTRSGQRIGVEVAS